VLEVFCFARCEPKGYRSAPEQVLSGPQSCENLLCKCASVQVCECVCASVQVCECVCVCVGVGVCVRARLRMRALVRIALSELASEHENRTSG
jgi:hypothetical protein